MGGFNVSRAAFTPSATQSLVLDADTAGDYGKVTKVTWGGELTTSTASRTRWVRPSTLGTTPTAIVTEESHPSNTGRCTVNTYATAPVIPAAPVALLGISWNQHGGGGIWSASQPDEEWVAVQGILPGAQIACVQDVGTVGTSMSTSIHWRED